MMKTNAKIKKIKAKIKAKNQDCFYKSVIKWLKPAVKFYRRFCFYRGLKGKLK